MARINSLENLILAALRNDLGWAIEPQIRDVLNDPSAIHEQNPNAIRQGLEWLQGVSTGCEEVDDMVANFIDSINEAIELYNKGDGE